MGIRTLKRTFANGIVYLLVISLFTTPLYPALASSSTARTSPHTSFPQGQPPEVKFVVPAGDSMGLALALIHAGTVGGTVVLEKSTYRFNYPGSAETPQFPPLTGTVILEGNGATLEFSGTTADSKLSTIFILENSSAEFRHVNLVVTLGKGRLISNRGTLVINDSTLSNAQQGEGGGIENYGSLTLTRTILSRHRTLSASTPGGAIWNIGNLTATCIQFRENRASQGGAVWNEQQGQVTINHSAFTGNQSNGGGAIFNAGSIALNATENYWGGGAPVVNETTAGIDTISEGVIADSALESDPPLDDLLCKTKTPTVESDTRPSSLVEADSFVPLPISAPVRVLTNEFFTTLRTFYPDREPFSELVEEPALIDTPLHSPDGRKIAYASYKSGNREVYVRDLSTGIEINLSNSPATWDENYVWSPDSRWVAFNRTVWVDFFSATIGVAKTDGSFSWVQGTVPANPSYRPSSPVWAADSQSFYFTQYYKVYQVGAAGGTPQAIFQPPPLLINNPLAVMGFHQIYALQGQTLLFYSYCSNIDISSYCLGVINLDGSGMRLVSTLASNESSQPSYSPDGSQVLFREGSNLYVINVSDFGTGIRSLIATGIAGRGVWYAPRNPNLSASAAGDNWDQATMRANKAYHSQAWVGKPINTWSGQYVYSSTDLTVYAQNQPLSFHRTYSSGRLEIEAGEAAIPLNAKDQLTLGQGWTHNFNMRLFERDHKMIFQQANGSRQEFEIEDEGDTRTFKAQYGLLADLVWHPTLNQYVLVMLPDRTRYFFDENGWVIRIDRSGTIYDSLDPSALPLDGDNQVTDSISPIELDYTDHTSHDTTFRLLTRVKSGNTYLHLGYHKSIFADGQSEKVELRLANICAGSNDVPLVPQVIILPGVSPCSGDNLPHVSYTYTVYGDAASSSQTNYLTSVTDAHNEVWHYQYLGRGGITYPLLEKVTDPTDAEVERQEYQLFGAETWGVPCASEKLWFCRVQAQFVNGIQTLRFDNSQLYRVEIQDGRALNNQYGPGGTQVYNYHPVGIVSYVTSTLDGQSLLKILGYDYKYNLVSEEISGADYYALNNHKWMKNGLMLEWVINAENVKTNFVAQSLDIYDNRIRTVVDPRCELQHGPECGSSIITDFDSTYDALPSQITQGSISRQLKYDPQARITHETVGDYTTGVCYNGEGQVRQTVQNLSGGENADPCSVSRSDNTDQNLVTSFEYDAAGRPLNITDPQGRLIRIRYNAAGDVLLKVVNATSPSAAIESLVFDPQQPDHNLITGYHYDALGRVIRVVEWRKPNLPYDPTVITSTPEVHVRFFAYDVAGRLISDIVNYVDGQPDNLYSDSNPAYDPQWDIIAHYGYDPSGNRILTQTHFPDGNERYDWVCYNELNLPKTAISHTSVSTFTDAFNPDCSPRLTITVDRNRITKYTYDAAGNLIERINEQANPQKQVTRICYDNLNRPVRQIENYKEESSDPCDDNLPSSVNFDTNRVTQYEYDNLGNTVKTTDPAGNITWTCYDPHNRPVMSLQNSLEDDNPFTQDGNCVKPNNLQRFSGGLSYVH